MSRKAKWMVIGFGIAFAAHAVPMFIVLYFNLNSNLS